MRVSVPLRELNYSRATMETSIDWIIGSPIRISIVTATTWIFHMKLTPTFASKHNRQSLQNTLFEKLKVKSA